VDENEKVDFGLGALPLLAEEAKENAGFVAVEVALEVNVTLPNGLVGFAAAGGGSLVDAKGLVEVAFGCCCCNGGADGAFAAADPPPPPNFRLLIQYQYAIYELYFKEKHDKRSKTNFAHMMCTLIHININLP